MKTKYEYGRALLITVAVLTVLWFIQGFYFVLNDINYGTSAIGLFILMAGEAIAVITATIVIAGFIDNMEEP